MQDLDKFKNEMNLSGKNVYVGNRYVPKIMGEWDNKKIYEPLSIVQYQGNSFTSRQYVPVGIEINNEEFWASTGNYNAQVEQYRQNVRDLEDDVDSYAGEVTNARNGESTLNGRLEKDKQEVNELLGKKVNYLNFSDLLISGQVTNIKLIGDSVTWGADGTNYTAGNSGRKIMDSHYEMNHDTVCWANMFRDYLGELYPSVDLFNAGINGYSMKQCSNLKTSWIGSDNDVLFLTLGINDYNQSESITKFEEYMEDVVTYALANSNYLFISTTTPVIQDVAIGPNGHSIEMINASIRKIANKHNVPLIDINDLTIELANEQGVNMEVGSFYYDETTHPSDLGHEMIWLAYQKGLGFKAKQTDFMVKHNKSYEKIMYARDFPSDYTLDSTPLEHPDVYENNAIIYVNVGENETDLNMFSPNGEHGVLVITNTNRKFGFSGGYIVQQFFSNSGKVLTRTLTTNNTWTNWNGQTDSVEDLTLDSSWEKSLWSKSFVLRKDNICHLQIVATGGLTGTPTQVIATVPDWYKPKRNLFVNCFTENSGQVKAFIGTDGRIVLQGAEAGEEVYIAITGTYPIN